MIISLHGFGLLSPLWSNLKIHCWRANFPLCWHQSFDLYFGIMLDLRLAELCLADQIDSRDNMSVSNLYTRNNKQKNYYFLWKTQFSFWFYLLTIMLLLCNGGPKLSWGICTPWVWEKPKNIGRDIFCTPYFYVIWILCLYFLIFTQK